MQSALVALVCALTCVVSQVAPPSVPGPVDERLAVVSVHKYPRPQGFVREQPSGIYYSSYSASGNDFDLLRIDPSTGLLETLVADAGWRRESMAGDRQHVLFGAAVPGTGAWRLVLRNIETGVEARSIRLLDRSRWAWVREDQVLLLQSTELLTFSVPDMKLAGKVSVDLPKWRESNAYRFIQPWGDKIVFAGADLVVLDRSGTVLSRYPLPRGGNHNLSACTVSRLLVAADTAFVNLGCGKIRAVDLHTGLPQYEIEVGGRFTPSAVSDEILFVADLPEYGLDRLQMFDVRTGRSLGVARAAATEIVAADHRLLLLRPEGYGSLDPITATVLQPNVAAILDPVAAKERMLDGCGAALSDGSIDLYRAIDDCEAAGIRRFLDALGIEPIDAEVKDILVAYAARLARTYSRFEESMVLLEKLGAAAEHEHVIRAAHRKLELVGRPIDEASRLPLPPGVQPVELAYSGSSKQYFIGPHLFESSYVDCERDPWGSPDRSYISLTVFDRTSMRRQARARLGDCYERPEQFVTGVLVVADTVVVGVEPEYDTGEANVTVLRLPDLTDVGTARVGGGVSRLVVRNNRLVHCESGTELDLRDAALKPADAALLVGCDRSPPVMEDAPEDPAERTFRAPLHTRNFVLTPVFPNPQPIPDLRRYNVRRSDERGPEFPLDVGVYPSILTSDADDLVLFTRKRLDATRLVAMDLGSREQRTLLELGTSSDWGSVARWRHYVFIAHGRDLMTYDLERRAVVGYERNMIRGGRQPFCSTCSDRNRIDKFLFDGERIFLITLAGPTSVVIDLPTYIKSLGAGEFFGLQ